MAFIAILLWVIDEALLANTVRNVSTTLTGIQSFHVYLKPLMCPRLL